MNLKQIQKLATGLIMALFLAGCAGPQFSANADRSSRVVQELKDNFNLADFDPGEIIEGSYNFETGGNPNAYFRASAKKGLPIQDACSAAHNYALSLSKSPLEFFPRTDMKQSHAVVGCIADYLDEYSQGFRWNGTLETGEPFKVILYPFDGKTLEVSTNFQDGGADEQDMGLELMPEDPLVTNFLDGFQSNRVKNGIDLYTKKSLDAVGLKTESENLRIVPIEDNDKFIRKFAVIYSDDFTLSRCFSALPWNEEIWRISDPGPSYPTYSVSSADKLNNFGSYLIDSDCK